MNGFAVGHRRVASSKGGLVVFSLFDASLNACRRAFLVMSKLKVAVGMLGFGLMAAATGENRAGDSADSWASRLLSARFAETHKLICGHTLRSP